MFTSTASKSTILYREFSGEKWGLGFTLIVPRKNLTKLKEFLLQKDFKIIGGYITNEKKLYPEYFYYYNNSKKFMLDVDMTGVDRIYYNMIFQLDQEGLAREVMQLFHKPQKSLKRECNIHLLCEAGGSLSLKKAGLNSDKIDVSLRYGSKILDFNKEVIQRLKTKSSGVVLLHGEPGTGKTSYIKYLTSKVDRKFVVIPNNLIGQISSPGFIPFLMDNPDLVLVIEDAEKLIQSRDSGQSGYVAEILNLSDGLIGSALNCSLIVTFNTHIRNIDSALLRKGRLIGEYKFDKLTKEESNKLLASLGKEPVATEAMTLAEIYNLEDKEFKVGPAKREAIGFRTH